MFFSKLRYTKYQSKVIWMHRELKEIVKGSFSKNADLCRM